MSEPPAPTSLMRIPRFDPMAVAVLGTDAHLPAVPAEQLTVAALRQRMAAPPPGWAPEIQLEHAIVRGQPTPAAVLVPLVQRDTLTVLLTERATHLAHHSGQIAFPGGKLDARDADTTAAALREAQEEVGLPPGRVEVIGTLPSYTTGTGFVIWPVIGLVPPDAPLEINAHEVADAFEVPLAFLMNPAHHRRHALEWQGVRREWFSMPYQDAQLQRERFIWGATAGMLRNLYRLLSA